MKTIHKIVLEITDEQELTLPVFSEILTIQIQKGTPCLWYTVDDTEVIKGKPRTLLMYGTGHPMRKVEQKYLSTFQTSDGLVFHVFEVKP